MTRAPLRYLRWATRSSSSRPRAHPPCSGPLWALPLACPITTHAWVRRACSSQSASRAEAPSPLTKWASPTASIGGSQRRSSSSSRRVRKLIGSLRAAVAPALLSIEGLLERRCLNASRHHRRLAPRMRPTRAAAGMGLVAAALVAISLRPRPPRPIGPRWRRDLERVIRLIGRSRRGSVLSGLHQEPHLLQAQVRQAQHHLQAHQMSRAPHTRSSCAR